MNEEEIIERETIAFSKGMKQGMLSMLTNVINFITKDNLLYQTVVGREIYNFCKNEKERIEKVDPIS